MTRTTPATLKTFRRDLDGYGAWTAPDSGRLGGFDDPDEDEDYDDEDEDFEEDDE